MGQYLISVQSIVRLGGNLARNLDRPPPDRIAVDDGTVVFKMNRGRDFGNQPCNFRVPFRLLEVFGSGTAMPMALRKKRSCTSSPPLRF